VRKVLQRKLKKKKKKTKIILPLAFSTPSSSPFLERSDPFFQILISINFNQIIEKL